MNLKLKVCGMRDTQNVSDLLKLAPDYMGFIFYENSPRNAGNLLSRELLMTFPQTTLKTGVFVNTEIEYINDKIDKYRLDAIQLHGNESVEFIEKLFLENSKHKFQIIKAFSVHENFEFSQLIPFENLVDYFLFDTKGKNHGGNGEKFNWKILENANINKPFFLSGGLDISDIEEIQNLKAKMPNLHALDINSKFEINAGLKDISKIETLVKLLYAEEVN